MNAIRRLLFPDACARSLARFGGALAMLVACPCLAVFGATKSFAPASILSGGTATMTISLVDPAAPQVQIVFSDLFPAGMTGVAGSAIATNCGGAVNVLVTAVRLDVTNGASAKAIPCDVQVTVTASVPASTTLINTTGTISYGPVGNVQTISGVSGALQVLVGIPPTFTSATPPDGQLGVPYLYSVSVAGTAPIAVTAAGLPTGLSFNPATLVISGTPTTQGFFGGNLLAANGFKPDAVQNFNILINSPPLTIVNPPGSLGPPVPVGAPINLQLVASGGIPPYTWSQAGGTLPPGTTLNANGSITGLPAKPGQYTFLGRVDDSAGTSIVQVFTIDVVKGDPRLDVTAAPSPTVSGQTMTITATLTSKPVSTGTVDFWIAGTGMICPPPFKFGDPASPVAPTRTAPVDATGRAQVAAPNLRIDDYKICAHYGGDANFNEVFAGPIDAYVIKGVLLPPPKVALAVHGNVATMAAVPIQVSVTPLDTTLVPGGTVRVLVDGQPVATATLDGGTAWVVLNAPAAPGTMSLAAEYAGDGVFPPASSAPVLVVVEDINGLPIPTLSDAVLALLALLLAAHAVIRLRRRP